MQSNEKKTSNRFECIKIKLYLYCQRRRNESQGCNRGGLRLTREQVVVRYIGLPFFFVLITQIFVWFLGYFFQDPPPSGSGSQRAGGGCSRLFYANKGSSPLRCFARGWFANLSRGRLTPSPASLRPPPKPAPKAHSSKGLRLCS